MYFLNYLANLIMGEKNTSPLIDMFLIDWISFFNKASILYD